MNAKIPTPIVDKNGVATTRHKNPDKATTVDNRVAKATATSVARGTEYPTGGVIDGDMSFEGKNVKVSLTYTEEGFNGDYDPSNPDDVPLARVDVLLKRDFLTEDEIADFELEDADEGWVYPYDHSSCTEIAANSSKEELEEWLNWNGAELDKSVEKDRELAFATISRFVNRASGSQVDEKFYILNGAD